MIARKALLALTNVDDSRSDSIKLQFLELALKRATVVEAAEFLDIVVTQRPNELLVLHALNNLSRNLGRFGAVLDALVDISNANNNNNNNSNNNSRHRSWIGVLLPLAVYGVDESLLFNETSAITTQASKELARLQFLLPFFQQPSSSSSTTSSISPNNLLLFAKTATNDASFALTFARFLLAEIRRTAVVNDRRRLVAVALKFAPIVLEQLNFSMAREPFDELFRLCCELLSFADSNQGKGRLPIQFQPTSHLCKVSTIIVRLFEKFFNGNDGVAIALIGVLNSRYDASAVVPIVVDCFSLQRRDESSSSAAIFSRLLTLPITNRSTKW